MNKNSGFTLIEVLVAVIVLAGGLLGLAALQAASLKNNQSSYNRSQATQLAYDMADRVRANVTGVGTYTSTLPSAAEAQADCTSVSTTCTTADIAKNDLNEWNTAIKTLSGGEGIVCLDSTPDTSGTSAASLTAAGCDATGNTYAIKLWWNDGDAAAKQLFVVSFRL